MVEFTNLQNLHWYGQDQKVNRYTKSNPHYELQHGHNLIASSTLTPTKNVIVDTRSGLNAPQEIAENWGTLKKP